MFESIFVSMRKIFKAEFDKVFSNALYLLKVYYYPIICHSLFIIYYYSRLAFFLKVYLIVTERMKFMKTQKTNT